MEMDKAGRSGAIRRRAVVVIPQKRPILARQPWVGVLVVLIGIGLFELLAYNILTHGPLIRLDEPLAQALHYQARHGSWLILGIMWFFSAVGFAGILLFTLALSVAWIIQKRWRELTMLIYGVGGGEALFQTLGNIVNRHRPVFADPLEKLSGPGFPSGHTTTSMLLFGLMLYLLWPRLPSGLAKALGIFLVLFMVAMIGFARMYIGDHYLTDIIGGAATGLAWGAAVFTGVEIAYWRHQPGGRSGRQPDTVPEEKPVLRV
jgi:membrane-associated phospholipid phosphatase